MTPFQNWSEIKSFAQKRRKTHKNENYIKIDSQTRTADRKLVILAEIYDF